MPKIITLVENTARHPGCIAEHGLSLYIETRRHRLLLDAGSSDALLHNAKVLGIDLSQVDTLILSHGHYDHSGGILPFAQINPNAKIYMQRKALADYYHGERYIGIDKRIASLPQLQLLDGDVVLDEELSLIANATGRRFWPQSNVGLTKRVPYDSAGESSSGHLDSQADRSFYEVQDNFDHEQCLVLTQANKHLLLSGCAHNGILNWLDRYQEQYHNLPQAVISGFHMMKKHGDYTESELATITQTARELSQTDIKFYTGHCTGQVAYDMMKPIMGEQLQQLSCGMQV